MTDFHPHVVGALSVTLFLTFTRDICFPRSSHRQQPKSLCHCVCLLHVAPSPRPQVPTWARFPGPIFPRFRSSPPKTCMHACTCTPRTAALFIVLTFLTSSTAGLNPFTRLSRGAPSSHHLRVRRTEIGLQPFMVAGMIKEFPEVLEVRPKRLKAVVKYLWKVCRRGRKNNPPKQQYYVRKVF